MNLTYKKFRARYIFTVGASVLIWAMLLFRIFFLQVVDARSLGNTIAQRFEGQEEIPPMRGNFYDRYGTKLTDNVEQYSFAARPNLIVDKAEVADLFSKHFGRSRTTYLKKLNSNQPYVYLERSITAARCGELLTRDLPTGVEMEGSIRRYYPYGEVASPLIGFVGTDNHGLTGLEQEYENQLAGTPGWQTVGSDGKGRKRIRGGFGSQEPVNGTDVVLTLDMDMQVIVEEELRDALIKHDADHAMAVLLHPGSGEILAMASLPEFDPNSRQTIAPDALKLHPVVSTFEPGSTFKIVGATACLDTRVIQPSDEIFCENGRYTIRGVPITDHKSYGTLTFAQVIENSSNIGVIKATERISKVDLFDQARRFGFSERTGIRFPGEPSGSLKNCEEWSGISKGEISIGYEVAITALQLALAYGSVANGGYLMKPQLVSRLITPDNHVETVDQVDVVRQVASTETMGILRGILEKAVEKGTGTHAYLPYLNIAGKTGTARKLEDGKYVRKYVASFASFYPAENPTYTLVIVIDHPRRGGYTGGRVAAPVAKAIYKRIHNLRRVSPQQAPMNQDPDLAADPAAPDPKFSGELLSTALPVIKAGNQQYKMPDLRQASLRSALQTLYAMGFTPAIHGSGRVIRQVPRVGATMNSETAVELYLSE